MEGQVVKFSVAEADIAKKKEIYMELVVADPNDEEGFQAVDTARKVMKADRVAVQKREKELKADANAWRKKVGDRAKELYALIEPIEEHLKAQCKIVTDEKARIEKEKAEAFQKKIDDRMTQLAQYTTVIPYQEVATMEDDLWEETLQKTKTDWETEQAAIADRKRFDAERKAQKEAEAKKRQEDLDRQAEEQRAEAAKIKAEQDAKEAELAEKQAKIDAQEASIQAEKDRIAKEEKAKQDAIDAAEREKAEAEALKEAEEKEKARAEQEAKENAEREELLKPEKQKAIEWVEAYRDAEPELFPIKDDFLAVLVASTADQIKALLTGLHRDIEEL